MGSITCESITYENNKIHFEFETEEIAKQAYDELIKALEPYKKEARIECQTIGER